MGGMLLSTDVAKRLAQRVPSTAIWLATITCAMVYLRNTRLLGPEQGVPLVHEDQHCSGSQCWARRGQQHLPEETEP